MSLRGNVAVVTGGARGLGKAYAEALLQRQAKVVLGDVLDDAGQSTAEEFNAKYGADAAIYVYTDVTKQDSVDALYSKAVETYGGVDVVINNAGIGGPSLELKRTMDINFNGVVRSCDAALKVMHKEKGGRGGTIVNIGSIAGLFVMPGGPLYHASKHAVVGYTRSLALMTPPSSGLRIQCLCPSFVRTNMTQYLQDREDNGDASVQDYLAVVGGWTELEDVVSTCMSLLKPDIPTASVVMVAGNGTHYVEREIKKTPFP